MTLTHIDRFYRLIKKFSFHLHHLFGPACTNVTMTQKLDYLFRAIQKYTNTTIPTTSHYNNVIQEILTLIPSTHSLREKCSNTEVFRVRIEYREIRTRKTSISGHFSRSDSVTYLTMNYFYSFDLFYLNVFD